MGERTGIEWTDHTFNPWIGCTKISAGCAKCYAETFVRNRMGRSHWGNDPRARTKGPWREVLRWNRAAAAEGVRRRVFCASLCDVFEDAPGLDEIRADLWPLIEQCTALDWQLLTKRPENITRMVPREWITKPRKNVWFGTSIEDQTAADARINWLLQAPAAVRFLSCEPLIGPVNLRRIDHANSAAFIDALAGRASVPGAVISCPRIGWVIVGGESGPGARPCDVVWVRRIVEQCKAEGVAAFVKQLGVCPTMGGWHRKDPGLNAAHPDVRLLRGMKDRKGGDPQEWPEDLRVRQFPEART